MELERARIALVHDWLTGMRGGEKVLECLAELFPRATLFSLLRTEDRICPAVDRLECRLSPVQKLPLLDRLYRHYLPLYPWAVGRLDLTDFDLVISTSHCVAKGAKCRPGALHISYVFTPMRYVWDLYPVYFGSRGPLVRLAARPMAAWLRRWDRRTCHRAGKVIGISRHVAARIDRNWGRTADIIHPPVELDRFRHAPAGDYYLIVSALAPYKGLDTAIEAANRGGLKLVIAGDGQDHDRLTRLAGPTVKMLGRVDDEQLVDLYADCRAFIFPGEEDFGITALEAMASGKPVIAYGRGGIWDTVVPDNPDQAPAELLPAGADIHPVTGPTGVFFYQPTPEALLEAVEGFESRAESFDPAVARDRAACFERELFKDRMNRYISAAWRKRQL